MYRAVTESEDGWEPRTTQYIKWTTEGAVKRRHVVSLVLCDVAHTSGCEEYDSILLSV